MSSVSRHQSALHEHIEHVGQRLLVRSSNGCRSRGCQDGSHAHSLIADQVEPFYRPGDLIEVRVLVSLRGVNYFRRLATTISAGEGQQGASPTTWRRSVVVVGRSVAVLVSAGAPSGAQAPSVIQKKPCLEGTRRSQCARIMTGAQVPDGARPCRGVSRAPSESWGPQTPAAPNDARGDRWPRPSPSDRGRSGPIARRSNCW